MANGNKHRYRLLCSDLFKSVIEMCPHLLSPLLHTQCRSIGQDCLMQVFMRIQRDRHKRDLLGPGQFPQYLGFPLR